MNTLLKDAPKLVRLAEAAGMINLRISPPTERVIRDQYRDYKREWERKRRERLKTKGLSSRGNPRVNKPRPELKGLKPNSREYLKAYHALRKATNGTH